MLATSRLRIVAASLFLALAILGYVAGHGHSAAAVAEKSRSALVGKVAVTAPVHWQPAAAAPAIPGLVIGVAYLWAWIGIPGGLYGTIWILALAFIARFMPDTVKALSTSFLQIHRELEEAAWVCGKGMLGTIRTIVLPLARPGVLASMTLLFVLAIRELGSSLFLYTTNTMVMSVLLLDYYEGGNVGKTAAFSLVQMVLLGVLIGGANWLSRSAAQGSVAQRIR